MIIEIDNRRNPEKSSSFLLGFRDTVMLSLGLLPGPITRHHLYRIYAKIHRQLHRIGLLSFDLPPETVFVKMIHKLFSQQIVQETYYNQNYVIDLTISGEAAFEVILSNLQIHPEFRRIINVYEFYRNSTT